jgi:ubiquinone/menaquinone biosynthesis C-methylase UbiE
MATHFENLSFYIPDLKNRRILDLGSGRGNFLIEAALAGANATGLEKFDEYIRISQEKARERGLSIEIVQGSGEKLPFPNSSFDFVNMCEVIEHVESPRTVLDEVYRVLRPGGKAYVSVPNRFGLKDQHFHLYFVNFLPRSLAPGFISLFGKHKEYTSSAGRQRLDEMHYYTYHRFRELGESVGFAVEDMRVVKIGRRYGNGLLGHGARVLYKLLRPWYFDSFHILLSRTK